MDPIIVSPLITAFKRLFAVDLLVKILAFATLSMLLFSSCTDALSPKDYCSWVEDVKNGLKIEENKGELHFTLQFRPVEYIALLNNGSSVKNMTDLLKAQGDFDELHHFTLNIGAINKDIDVMKVGLENKDNLDERFNYFSYGVQKDFYLVQSGDTLPCVLYHFEKAFNLSPYHRMVLGFEKREATAVTDMTFIFNDKIWDGEPVYFTITQQNLAKIPQIRLPE